MSPSPKAPTGIPSTLMLETSRILGSSCQTPSERSRRGSGACLRAPSGPKRAAKRSWSSWVRSCPRTQSTRCSFQACWILATTSSDSSFLRSTPLISAPQASPRGMTSTSLASNMFAPPLDGLNARLLDRRRWKSQKSRRGSGAGQCKEMEGIAPPTSPPETRSCRPPWSSWPGCRGSSRWRRPASPATAPRDPPACPFRWSRDPSPPPARWRC